MTPPAACCNPFNKQGHNCVYTNLFLLTSKCDDKFESLFGLYVCAPCKVKLYKNKDTFRLENFPKLLESSQEKIEDELTEDEENMKEDNESKSLTRDEDFVCKAVDDEINRLKLASAFQDAIMAPPAKKKKLSLSDSESLILQQSLSKDSLNILNATDDSWIDDFKLAMAHASTREQKKVLLTTIPVQWSIRKISKEFGVGRRIVSSARKLQKEKGYCAEPNKKKGRAMSSNLVEKVQEYYLSDEVSRVMPGVRDLKSIKINGKRQKERVSIVSAVNFFSKTLSIQFLNICMYTNNNIVLNLI